MLENRQDLATLRDKQIPGSLEAFIKAFGYDDPERGQAYVFALRRFLGEPPPQDVPWNYTGTLSPHTRRAYSSTLQEFFEWLARERGRIVPPHEVISLDIERYVQWLTHRTFTVQDEKLRDGDEPLRLAIYEVVQKIGSTDRQSISLSLPKSTIRLLQPGGPFDEIQEQGLAALSHHLGRMVLHDLLVRSPTLAEIRADVPMAGINEFRIAVLPDGHFAYPRAEYKDLVVDLDDVFMYSLPPARGVSRRTIVLKLTALSSFWERLREGENVPGAGPVLQHNIVAPVLKRVGRGLNFEVKQTARQQKPDPVSIIRLIRQTESPRTLAEYRDRALLLFLLFTGVRVAEATSLRRGRPTVAGSWSGWLDAESDPPSVVLIRKGGKQQILPYPPIALQALLQFQTVLEERAAPVGAQYVDVKAPRYVPPHSPRWRYAELSRSADAPLFPSLYLWGANSDYNYESFKPNTEGVPYFKPFTREGVTAFLKRTGRKAGLSEAELAKIHPHALRHFAAVAMFKGGKPLKEIQEMLGHDSIVTTERYIEEITTEIAQSGQNEILKYLQQFEVPEPEVVETRAEPARKRRPRKRPERPAEAPAEPEAEEPEAEEIPAEAPDEAPQVAQIVESVEGSVQLPPPPSPQNILPVAPEPAADPVETVLTAKGPVVEAADRVIAVGGEVHTEPGMVPLMIDNVSSGSPDRVYQALHEALVSGALNRFGQASSAVKQAEKRRSAKTTEAEKSQIKKELPALREARTKAKAELDAYKIDPIEWTLVQNRVDARRGLQSGTILGQGDSGEDQVQANSWLLTHYDPWPKFFGVGRESLLPWYAKGSATREGYVLSGNVVAPPIPVLAPEQAAPQTELGAAVRNCAEALYDEWLNGNPEQGVGPSPTRAFGVVRWWALFSYLSSKLKDTKVTWQPWPALCTLGQDIRAHEDRYLCDWLRNNAHTYVTAVRAFLKVPRGERKRGEDDEFLRDFSIATYQGHKPDDDLPEWMAEDDPVHALYEQSANEFDKFADWIGSVTGIRLGAARHRARDEQKLFIKKEVEIDRDTMTDDLKLYYETVDKFRDPKEEPESKSDYKLLMDLMEKQFLDKYGLDINDPDLRALQRKERIKTLLAQAISEGAEEEGLAQSKNLLGDSQLFDPRYFSIDQHQHTIVHTPEFRQEFFEQYGQDSELVMRRAARAMWEYAKEKIEAGKKLDYSFLYSMMLQYISWVVPPGEEMERQIHERLPHLDRMPARIRWLSDNGRAVRNIIYSDEPLDVDELERQQGEDDAEWSERIAPLLQDRYPDVADLITAANAGGLYQQIMMQAGMSVSREAVEEVVQVLELRRQPDEDEDEWAERILEPMREYLAEQAEQRGEDPDAARTLVTLDNVIQLVEYVLEEEVEAPTQVAVASEIGRQIAPTFAREEREGHEAAAREHASEGRQLLTMTDEQREQIRQRRAAKRTGKRRLVSNPRYVLSLSGGREGEGYVPNASGREFTLSHRHWLKTHRYIRNAQQVLPSPFSMIAAMSQDPAETRRGLLGILGL